MAEETMDNSRIQEILNKVKTCLVVLLGLFFWTINPLQTWAENEKEKVIDKAKANFLQSEETETARAFDRFQIELYGGIIFLSPNDLNLFVSNDTRMQGFFYDSRLDYLVATGEIRSWTRAEGEKRNEIQRSYPIGGRLKYYLNETIALSLGFKYMTSTHSLDLEYQYFRNELSGERYNESIRYSPYSLSAKAYIPTLGIHISKTLKGKFVLEGFLCGGPMFADCRYLSDWGYEWVTEGPGYTYVTYSSNGVLEEKGSGTGISLDLGGRINYPLVASFEIFLEASYAYQVAKSISGPGMEDIDGRSTSWDGRWGIKRETLSAPWGEFDTEFPTGYWPNNSEEERIRDFELDLSGFHLKLGLSFRF
jgi:hypothetical protein